ncbi:hypothetical protein QNH23_03550 [Siminovitchia fortis]|uniref:Uncharacterized protein n=1 Tax=Siminovitchia fortis TaxID=254758 RepID=A0A443ITV0_9BACI|nr:hypothetical protein [Siminovitchia fortis]RWR11121.1 hypothetical protein D4N35_009005 [Siminovitchia fortis]WHY82477.1 hypothetical protein QNH23_03550 [Siminovitchia fortis]
MNEEILNQILASVQGLTVQVKSVKDEVQSVKSDVQGVKDEVQGVRSQMNNRFDALETRMSNMELKMHDLKEEMKNLGTDNISVKQAVIETNKVVKRIEQTQESHERTLDLLSRRSIDQEAEIKRIK